MTTWFTSDTHFGHARIIELSNRRFGSVDEMNEALVDNWNSVVKPEDTVYHLGDFNLGKFDESIEYAGLLNGHKILVTGNHDRLFVDPEERHVEKNQRYRDRFRPRYLEHFERVEEGSSEAAAELLLLPEIKVDLTTGKNSASSVLRMSHFPYTGDSHDKPRYDAIRPKDDGKVLLHGHTHQKHVISKSAKGTLQIHVGVDSWAYAPVSLDMILSLIEDINRIDSK